MYIKEIRCSYMKYGSAPPRPAAQRVPHGSAAAWRPRSRGKAPETARDSPPPPLAFPQQNRSKKKRQVVYKYIISYIYIYYTYNYIYMYTPIYLHI